MQSAALSPQYSKAGQIGKKMGGIYPDTDTCALYLFIETMSTSHLHWKLLHYTTKLLNFS